MGHPSGDFSPIINCLNFFLAPVVRFAQEFGIHRALRASWYELSRSHAEEILPFAIDQNTPRDGRFIDRRVTNLTALNHQDLVRLLISRERMRNVVNETCEDVDSVILTTPQKVTGSCLKRKQDVGDMRLCAKSMGRWWTSQKEILHELLYHDPLAAISTMERQLSGAGPSWDRDLDSMCTACRRKLAHHLHFEAEMIWIRLPDIFDLHSQGWEEEDED